MNYNGIFDRYLTILGIENAALDLESLQNISTTHMKRIPFENVSKIHRVKVLGKRYIPELSEYLDGIESENSGGTCFTNNYYLNQLLNHLGFDVRLSSADIAVTGAPPDGHMLNVVTIDKSEFIVDVGYGAPFLKPLPRNSKDDIEINLGSDRYLLKPQDSSGKSKLEVYRNDQLVHGYLMKPEMKIKDDFEVSINRSYQDEAPFLNRLMVAKFGDNSALVLTNNKLTEMHDKEVSTTYLSTREEIHILLNEKYLMSEKKVEEAVATLGDNILFG